MAHEDLLKEYLQYKTVQRWIIKLTMQASSTDNGIPYDTALAAKHALKDYCAFRDLTPDQLIIEANTELRNLGRLENTIQSLESYWFKTVSKSLAKQRISMVKSFYKANYIVIPFTLKKPKSVRPEEHIPTSDEIRAICDAAPIKHRSWILANNYLGLRVGAIRMLTVADFQTENWTINKPLYPVNIRFELSGTFKYTSWIGHDAMETLKTYFKKMHFKAEDHPWDYDREWLNKQFKKYAYQSGVIAAPEGLSKNGFVKGISPLHSHVLRKRRQTIQESVGTAVNWVDHLIGHIPRGANGFNYSKPNDEDLYNEVLKALPKLEINGHHDESPTEPNVAVQRTIILEQAKRMGLPEERLSQLVNLLKLVRTKPEMEAVNVALTNDAAGALNYFSTIKSLENLTMFTKIKELKK